jgi:hypothetical protein
MAVGGACIAVLIFKHMWLLGLLPVPIILYLIKTLGVYVYLYKFPMKVLGKYFVVRPVNFIFTLQNTFLPYDSLCF